MSQNVLFHELPSDPGTKWGNEQSLAIDTNHYLCDHKVFDPELVALPQGGFRLFYSASSKELESKGFQTGILSASSNRYAAEWRRDPLYRLLPDDTKSETGLYGLSVVPLHEGGYRMYFEVRYKSQPSRILSAYSKDSMNWAREPGFRLKNDDLNYEAPCLVKLKDRCCRLYAKVTSSGSSASQMIILDSKNGIEFEQNKLVSFDNYDFLGGNVYGIETGGYRLFFKSTDSLLSVFSSDGLDWTQSLQICEGDGLNDGVGVPCVVGLPQEQFRMLFKNKGGTRINSVVSPEI